MIGVVFLFESNLPDSIAMESKPGERCLANSCGRFQCACVLPLNEVIPGILA